MTDEGHIAGGLSRAIGIFLDAFGDPIAHLAVSGLERHKQRSPLLDCLNGMRGDPRAVFLGMGAENPQAEDEKKQYADSFFHRHSPYSVEVEAVGRFARVFSLRRGGEPGSLCQL